MEKSTGAETLLNMFLHPVFGVENGQITAANDAAKARQIPAGVPVADLITNGLEEYEAFEGGYLSINLCVEGVSYLAGITRADGTDIFHLYSDSMEAEFRTMALISQQMRQPLSNIMANLDALLPADAIRQDPEMARKADQINRGIYQMIRKVSNLSAMSGFSGNREYAISMQNISAFVGEIMERCTALAEKAGKTLQFTPAQVDIFSLTDSELLERAIYNLVSNAIKFSPENSTITARLTQANQKIRFTIQNTCEENTNLQNLFSRFLREPGLEDSRYGIGLGIPLVRFCAASHKGSLLMDRPEANMVRFSLTLPIRQDSAGALRSPIRGLDYLGGYDHGLIELSDVLPSEAFRDI